MKNELFNTGNIWLNFFSTFILLVPVICMLLKKSTWNKNFIPLAVCFLLLLCTGLINNDFISLGKKANTLFITASVIVQAPLILLFLNYFRLNPDLKKAIRVTPLAYLFGGILFLFVKGVSTKTIGLLLGTGLSLVLIYGLIIFFRQIKESVRNRRETGKAFMISAIVFAYACYLFIFLMSYVFHSKENLEIKLLFQLATIISTLLVSIGLLINVNTPVKIPVEKKMSNLPMLTDWEEYTTGRN
jgi:drug/metabolite transporter (DMT)-like permease